MNDEASDKTPPAAKPRSPVERALVWGFILIALGLVAIQANAYMSFRNTNVPLQKAVQQSDDSEHSTTESMVKELIKGSPAYETGPPEDAGELPSAVRMDTYTWKGLLRSYSIRVYYGVGDNPEVVETRTN
jgi:hypothetical protein